jgi:hypothetical protein
VQQTETSYYETKQMWNKWSVLMLHDSAHPCMDAVNY